MKTWIFFGAFRAPGWPETDSPRKIITKSGVETRIRALGTRFVAIFRFREICDVDYNLSSKIIMEYWKSRNGQSRKGNSQKSKFPQQLFDFFWIFLGPPGAGNGSKMCPRRPAFEPQSIVQIRPMATRLVAKNCFQNFRNSRNSFSARCISAYSECRKNKDGMPGHRLADLVCSLVF